MRSWLPALLLLAPVLGHGQDIPSLQRPNPALPITDSIERLAARLGQPGGAFAAAQLVLLRDRGFDVLRRARESSDPLVRLDAACGLEQTDGEWGYSALTPLLGDPDPRVAGQAYHALRLAGKRAEVALTYSAYHDPVAAADMAVDLLRFVGKESAILEIARDAHAAGRGAALRSLYLSWDQILPVFEDAAHDRREPVRIVAMRRIVYGDKTILRGLVLERLANSSDPEIRLSLVKAMDEDPGKILDPAYERAASLGAVGTRRSFARMVVGALYDPKRMIGATAILARFTNDRAKPVGDAAVHGLYLFVSDRIEGNEVLPWNRLPARSVALLRKGVGARLTGPFAFEAAVVLAQLHDGRAYGHLVKPAFASREVIGDLALLSLADLGDRRLTPRLLKMISDPAYNDTIGFRALGRLRDPASIGPLLRRARTGGNRLYAAYALSMMGNRAATPGLLALTKETLDPSFYLPLGVLGGPGVAEFLLDRFEHGPEDQIQYADAGLSEMKDPAVVERLKTIAARDGGIRGRHAKGTMETIAYRMHSPTSPRAWMGGG